MEFLSNSAGFLLVAGVVLAAIGILGGGITVKEIDIPKLSLPWRITALLVGLVFLLGGGWLRLHPISDPIEARYTNSQTSEPERTFHNPLWHNHRVDACEFFANGCGQQAANKWCRSQDPPFSFATDFVVQSNVGGLGIPTIIIGTDQLCEAAYCSAFSSITCHP